MNRPSSFCEAGCSLSMFLGCTFLILTMICHTMTRRSWTDSTPWWQEGNVVRDDISLSMGDAPTGRYRLAARMIQPDSGERSLVTEGTGE